MTPACSRGIRDAQQLEEGLGIEPLDDCLGVESGDRVLLEPVGLALGEDASELVLTHRDEGLARPHQVRAIQVVRGPARPRWNVEHQYPAIRVRNVLDVHPEADGLKERLGGADEVRERARPTTFRGGLSAIPSRSRPPPSLASATQYSLSFAGVELVLGFLELQPLMLRWRLAPQVDLFRGCHQDCEPLGCGDGEADCRRLTTIAEDWGTSVGGWPSRMRGGLLLRATSAAVMSPVIDGIHTVVPDSGGGATTSRHCYGHRRVCLAQAQLARDQLGQECIADSSERPNLMRTGTSPSQDWGHAILERPT